MTAADSLVAQVPVILAAMVLATAPPLAAVGDEVEVMERDFI